MESANNPSPESEALAENLIPSSPQLRDYWCFISYRHADNQEEGRRWATWLHHEIETYEVPADLVGTKNKHGETIPHRIYPVFRDEEELPADADLATPIYRALDRSKMLVVLCSPRAMTSTYVDDEIRYFKQIGRADRVLAAILEGEPNVSWDASKRILGIGPDQECFPKSLQHPVDQEGKLDLTKRSEPIAADFRLPSGTRLGYTTHEVYRRVLALDHTLPKATIDRRVTDYQRQCELAKLKILAGILGVSLGVLTNRDAAYQLLIARQRARVLRRWIGVVSGLAIIAALAGSFAWLKRDEAMAAQRKALLAQGQAVKERNQAQVERTHAEDAERKATTARDAAVVSEKKAVESRRAADELVNYMQVDLSVLLGRLDQIKLMDGINSRIDAYHKTYPSDEANPAQAQARIVSLFAQGDALKAKKQLVEALAFYKEGIAIAAREAREHPDSSDAQYNDPLGHERVANLLNEVGSPRAALDEYQQSLAGFEKLAAANPKWIEARISVITIHRHMGSLYDEMSEQDQALTRYRRALELAKAGADDFNSNSTWNHLVAVTELALADHLSAQIPGMPFHGGQAATDTGEAFGLYYDASSKLNQVLKAQPNNFVWKQDLARSQGSLGRLYASLGDWEDAVVTYRNGITGWQFLSERDEENMEHKVSLASAWKELGDAMAQQPNPSEAKAAYEECIAILERLTNARPDSADVLSQLMMAYQLVADAFTELKQLTEADRFARKAMSAAENGVEKYPENLDLKLGLAQSLAKVAGVAKDEKRWDEAITTWKRVSDLTREPAQNPKIDSVWGLMLAMSGFQRVEILREGAKVSTPQDKEAAREDVELALEALEARRKEPQVSTFFSVYEDEIMEFKNGAASPVSKPKGKSRRPKR